GVCVPGTSAEDAIGVTILPDTSGAAAIVAVSVQSQATWTLPRRRPAASQSSRTHSGRRLTLPIAGLTEPGARPPPSHPSRSSPKADLRLVAPAVGGRHR